MNEHKNYLTTGFEAVNAIRPLLKKNFGNPARVEQKSDGSLVTNIDPEAEKIVRNILHKKFPEHGILGEEIPAMNKDSEFQWIIDPIDGTKQFIRGIPVYGSILALYKNGEPILGIIDVPETDSRYHALKGQGAYWNGKQIHIKDLPQNEVQSGCLAVSTRLGFKKIGAEKEYDELCQTHPEIMTLPNCYGHGLAARDVVTAMINFNINLWDIAATKILIEEAGGKFAVRKRGDKYDMICGKPTVVDWLLNHFEIVPTGL